MGLRDRIGTIQASDMYTGHPSTTALGIVGNTNGTTHSCVIITVSSGITQFRPYFIEAKNNASAYIEFSAEL